MVLQSNLTYNEGMKPRSIYLQAILISVAVSTCISLLISIVVVGSLRMSGVTVDSQSARIISREDMPVVDVVKNANPAVVSVIVRKNVLQRENGPQSLFELFFGSEVDIGEESREVGGGSGFFVSSDGYIVTNKHVIDDTDANYAVFTNDGSEYQARVVALDPFFDIGILKVDGNNTFPYLRFADSDSILPGERVIAIGNALGEFRNTVSVGVVSGVSRSIVAGDLSGKREALENVIQTDAAINVGNSGGPLLDLSGAVIGVNVATALGSENIGFALPANVVAPIVLSVTNDGEIVYPYIGIQYVEINPLLQRRLGLPVSRGLLLQSQEAVIPNSPAERAGLLPGDIVTHMNGIEVNDENRLGTLVRKKEIGDSIELTIRRGNTERIVSLVLEAFRVEAL